jgi:predicted DNA-binding transcriptional regulator YafY
VRADRLISILMLLQMYGKRTAGELAAELEVSERTIYRDVEALSLSGIPVYAEHGPGGGLMLLESYRTTLTGLNLDEQRALFMLLGSSPLDRLGVSQELRSAVMKISAALPEARRVEEEQVRQRFFLDWSWWFHAQEPTPHLLSVQQAVWGDLKLRIHYRTFFGSPVTVEVDPYALVAKAGAWFLVAGMESIPRVYRITWLSQAEVLDTKALRPENFDLPGFWRQWCADYERQQRAFLVKLRVAPELAQMLPLYFGEPEKMLVNEGAAQDAAQDADEWVTLTLPFESFNSARERILSFGAAAEVLEPLALRCSVRDFAEQIAAFYQRRAVER